jgi:hypothetical protein
LQAFHKFKNTSSLPHLLPNPGSKVPKRKHAQTPIPPSPPPRNAPNKYINNTYPSEIRKLQQQQKWYIKKLQHEGNKTLIERATLKNRQNGIY